MDDFDHRLVTFDDGTQSLIRDSPGLRIDIQEATVVSTQDIGSMSADQANHVMQQLTTHFADVDADTKEVTLTPKDAN